MSPITSFKPSISIDFKKYLIRIHKKTLCSMGNPMYVLLLVNPETLTLVIHKSSKFDSKAHCASKSAILKKKSFEIHSRTLLESICELCDTFENNKLYHIYGETSPDKNMVRFYIPDAIGINED